MDALHNYSGHFAPNQFYDFINDFHLLIFLATNNICSISLVSFAFILVLFVDLDSISILTFDFGKG